MLLVKFCIQLCLTHKRLYFVGCNPLCLFYVILFIILDDNKTISLIKTKSPIISILDVLWLNLYSMKYN